MAFYFLIVNTIRHKNAINTDSLGPSKTKLHVHDDAMFWGIP
jgi:hypothetical protein